MRSKANRIKSRARKYRFMDLFGDTYRRRIRRDRVDKYINHMGF